MGRVSIDDILITPLKRIPVEGGDVLHGIKCSDPGFAGFGEAYFSAVDMGAIKAWKRHTNMTLNLVVPVGRILFAFLDEGKRLLEIETGEDHYCRLTVPPSIWFGFQGLAAPGSLLLNVADIQHDPDEVERKGKDEIRFAWRSIP